MVVCVTVEEVTRQEQAEDADAGELALRQLGVAVAARLTLLPPVPQLAALIVVVVVPPMKVDVEVLQGTF